MDINSNSIIIILHNKLNSYLTEIYILILLSNQYKQKQNEHENVIFLEIKYVRNWILTYEDIFPFSYSSTISLGRRHLEFWVGEG